MTKFRLRTKFLVSLLAVSSSLTFATLWLVHRSVRLQLQKEITEDLENSVIVFRDFQRQRESHLTRSEELLANLHSLKALMTSRDAATIQDASGEIWRLAPSDVFVLASPVGKVLAIQTSVPGITGRAAEELLKNSLKADQPSFWWYGAGHLYQVFLQPIYFGPARNDNLLAVLCVGHDVSEVLAMELSRIASSQVAFFYGNTLIVSTLQQEPQ